MKKIILTLSILAMITAFTPGVNAHPGGTDSEGGHTNHNTGEYHYHHGYPAHDHYDMDGDGDVDCPYDFEDLTNRGSTSSFKNDTVSKTTNESKIIPSGKQRDRSDVAPVVYIIIVMLVAALWLSPELFRKSKERS